MDARTFKKEMVAKKTPGVSREALDVMIERYIAEGKAEKRYIPDCIMDAAALDLESLSEGDDCFHLLARGLPAAQGELLVKQVEPWVESIRQELFGKEAPPFKSDETGYKKAVRWIKQEAEKQPKPSKKESERSRELDREIMDRLQKKTRLTRQHTRFEYRALILPYADLPDRWVKKLSVTIDKPLGPLADASEKIAETTGFRQHMVVAWILAGIRPALPGARLYTPVSPTWTMTPAGEIFTRRARIDIFSPDMKPSEIVELYKKAQDHLRPLHLSTRNRALLEVMEKFGDLEDGQEKRDYWEAVRKAYNDRKPKGARAYKNWEGPRMAFIRLDPIHKKPFPRLKGRA
jgi:hypothetical protein